MGIVRSFDPKPDYIAQINRLIDLQPIRDAGLTVVVDNMWGNGAGWLSDLLAGGRTKVIEVHAERNPIFPEMLRPEPIPPNVDAGLAAGLQNDADCVCIMDGDADRCGFGDENGEFVDQLRVFGLLVMYFLDVRGERGPIVKTLSTHIDAGQTGRALRRARLPDGRRIQVHRPQDDGSGCADRWRGKRRVRLPRPRPGTGRHPRQPLSAGHDGTTGLKPTELLDRLFDMVGGPHYYDRIDTRLESNEFKVKARARLDAVQPETIGGLRCTEKVTVDGYKFVLEDGGWLLVRFSGTEPLIRVYCETIHGDQIPAILADGMKMAGLE